MSNEKYIFIIYSFAVLGFDIFLYKFGQTYTTLRMEYAVS